MKLLPLTSLAIVFVVAPYAWTGSGGGHGGNGKGGHRVSVSLSPTAASVGVSQSQQFTANVSGTANTAVTWSVNGIAGGNSAIGTVDSAGVYTAPSQVPGSSIAVTADSVAQPAASASAAVTVMPPPPVTVTVSPKSASLQLGQTQQFSATVSGTTNAAVNWLVNGIAGGNSTLGTVNSSGSYTAPSTVPGSSITVTADSVAQTAVSASAAVTVVTPPPVTVTISPTSASLQLGQSQQFSATVSGTTNTAVSWLVNGVIGGSAAAGTITTNGLYTTPSSVPTASVTVTARSMYDSTRYANSAVSIIPPVTHQVSLSWSASASTVAGYNVYRSLQAGTGYARINPALETATVYTDSNVSSGKTYFYAVTAVDSSGVESGYSNVSQATIP